MTHIQNQIDMAKRKKYLDSHTYKIWEGNDGWWCTYLPDKIKGRKFIKKHSKKEIEDIVITYYERREVECGRTFIDVYKEWRLYHNNMISDNSIAKYDSDFIRFFEGKDFIHNNIKSLTEDDVNVFIKDTTVELLLCKVATKTLFQYIDNTFMFAERHGYIEKSPTTYLSPKNFYKYCQPSEKSKKSKVINKTDFNKLYNKIQEDHINHPEYIPSYAVEFAFLTGMRVGEIAGLTWDCVFDDYILVNKSQKYNIKQKTYYIDATKNGKERKFPITNKLRKLLNTIRTVEEENGFLTEWVFSDGNGHINYRKICSCIKNKCRQCAIETRGIHACRKTLNSNMRHNGVSSVVAASLLGHTPIVNEQYYTFDVADMEEKASIVSSATIW